MVKVERINILLYATKLIIFQHSFKSSDDIYIYIIWSFVSR